MQHIKISRSEAFDILENENLPTPDENEGVLLRTGAKLIRGIHTVQEKCLECNGNGLVLRLIQGRQTCEYCSGMGSTPKRLREWYVSGYADDGSDVAPYFCG